MSRRNAQRDRRDRRSVADLTSGGTCPPPCGKYRFTSRTAAKRARRRLNDTGLNAYQCPHGADFWHLGHLPAPVTAGEITRADIHTERTHP